MPTPITRIQIDIATQTLLAFDDAHIQTFSFKVATAINGPGQVQNSECTPTGKHIIRAKVGGRLPVNTVFVSRRPTGELFSPELKIKYPKRDWVLTRIMWLSGCEPGHNRLGNVDTMRRYVYIHGAPDADLMGIPSSHGCIKMRNNELIKLFNATSVGTCVEIHT